MVGLKDPSRQALLLIAVVVAVASVSAAVAGEYLIAPLEAAFGEPPMSPSESTDPSVAPHEEHRCNGHFNWFG